MTQVMRVATDALNLRSSPSITGAWVGRKVRGDLVYLIERAPVLAGGYAWRETVDGKWIAEYKNNGDGFDRYLVLADASVSVSPSLRLVWPCAHRPCVILSKFREPRPSFDHEGVDIRGYAGDLVFACADGAVYFVAPPEHMTAYYGCHIILRHEAAGQVFFTYYAHLSGLEARTVRGAVVRAGDPIGYVGSTGNSTGAHLHLTLQQAGNFSRLRGISLAGCIDPEPLLIWPV